MTNMVELVRSGGLDAELGALLWLLVDAGVPVHAVSDEEATATALAVALRALAREPGAVTSGTGAGVEDVLRQPVPIRPPTGAVVVLAEGRVVAAHFLRPPLRDAGGHVRPQGPAVLSTWDPSLRSWEHFAWGVTPELAEAAGRRAGDFEIEQARRREYLDALVASPIHDGDEIGRALRAYALPSAPS